MTKNKTMSDMDKVYAYRDKKRDEKRNKDNKRMTATTAGNMGGIAAAASMVGNKFIDNPQIEKANTMKKMIRKDPKFMAMYGNSGLFEPQKLMSNKHIVNKGLKYGAKWGAGSAALIYGMKHIADRQRDKYVSEKRKKRGEAR